MGEEKMNEPLTPEQRTRRAWVLLNSFTNSELAELLQVAGVKAPADKAKALHQALLIWFEGNIPCPNEVRRLNETISRWPTTPSRS